MLTANDSENKLAKARLACRRGMLELDLMLQNFCETVFPTMAPEKQDLFTELLDCADQDLHSWLLGTQAALPKFQDMVLVIRHLHGTTVASPA